MVSGMLLARQQCLYSVAALLLVVSCFREPDLDECGVGKECPNEELPLCIQGYCFHHTMDYTVPICVSGQGAENNCCDLKEAKFGGLDDSPCRLWQVEHPDALLSAPTAAPDGRVVYARATAADKLFLHSRSRYGKVEWERELDDFVELDILAAPAVNAAGNAAVAGESSVYLREAKGAPLGSDGADVIDLTGKIVGAPAFCDDGSLYVLHTACESAEPQASEGGCITWVNPEGEVKRFAIPLGDLPPHLGPVVDTGTGIVVVPTARDGRASLTMFDPKGGAPPVQEGEHPDGGDPLGWVKAPMAASDQLAGLALGADGVFCAAWENGLVFCDHVAGAGDGKGESDGAWGVESTSVIGPISAPPVMQEDGHLILAATGGGIYKAKKGKTDHLEPDLETTDTVLLAAPLRMDGYAMVEASASGLHLAFHLDLRSLPGESREGEKVAKEWGTSCNVLKFSIPGPEGILGIVCDDKVLGLAVPEIVPGKAPWPGPRGRYNSGCR